MGLDWIDHWTDFADSVTTSPPGIVFDILKASAFWKYSKCWVFFQSLSLFAKVFSYFIAVSHLLHAFPIFIYIGSQAFFRFWPISALDWIRWVGLGWKSLCAPILLKGAFQVLIWFERKKFFHFASANILPSMIILKWGKIDDQERAAREANWSTVGAKKNVMGIQCNVSLLPS